MVDNTKHTFIVAGSLMLGSFLLTSLVGYGILSHKYKTIKPSEIKISLDEDILKDEKKVNKYEEKREKLFLLSDKDKVLGLSDLELISLYSQMGYTNVWKYKPSNGKIELTLPCSLNFYDTNKCPIENLDKALLYYEINKSTPKL